jgi:hypothetical protein
MEIPPGENVSSGSLNLITTLLQFLRYNPTPAEQMCLQTKYICTFMATGTNKTNTVDISKSDYSRISTFVVAHNCTCFTGLTKGDLVK